MSGQAGRHGRLRQNENDEVGFFRREALLELQRKDVESRPLLVPPTWARWSVPIAGVALVGFIFLLLLGRWQPVARGEALLTAVQRTRMFALEAGAVVAVRVAPGQSVMSGQPIVDLDRGSADIDVEQARRSFEATLLQMLRDSTDAQATVQSGIARSVLIAAESKAARRSIVAPSDGVVGEIRVRVGQLLGAGELVATLSSPESAFEATLFLPAQAAEDVRMAETAILQWPDWPDLVVRIRTSESSVVGPAEARRLAGSEAGDTLTLPGAVTVAKAFIANGRVNAGGVKYALLDGMKMAAIVPLPRQTLLRRMLTGGAQPSRGAEVP